MSHAATCDEGEHVHPPELALAGPDARATARHVPSANAARLRAPRHGLLATRELGWASAALVLFIAGLVLRAAGLDLAADALFALCYAAGGWEPGLAGLRALRRSSLDVDLLMVLAALVAAGIGEVLDGALLIVIFSSSGSLEALSTRRTREAVTSLLRLAPEQACRIGPDGAEELVEAESLAVGARVVVRPGERVPADGIVVLGSSEVDQASITGEALPVATLVGDEVFAGTLNGTGALTIAVSRPAARSVVARIAALVEQASETKARTQLFIERVEQRYSVSMVAVTGALFVVPLGLGAALQPTLLRAMTFMIVASPCAVVLATMPPYLAAIANAVRHGVLVKSAVAMEQLGSTTRVAFDKTGTLTRGSPRLVCVESLSAETSDDEVLALAAAVEQASEHPLGRAVVTAAHERGLVIPPGAEFHAVPGEGVHALVGTRRVGVARPARLGHDDAAWNAAARRAADELESSGLTAVVVSVEGEPVGVLAFSDEVRPDAKAAVAALAALTGTPPVLLTGDNPRAAARLASEVGIEDVRALLTPAEKADAVGELERDDARVALVGDWVNDAPALAAAHVGVAMGRHGSDLALETADVVVVRDELAALPGALRISRRAQRVVKANLAFAALVIATLVAFDLGGHLPLPLGVAGHEGSTVVVGLNGLRLLRRRHWED